MPRPSNPTRSRARTSPTFTGRLRLRRRKRRLSANINSPVARKSERNASPTQTKTSGGRSMRIGISAPTLAPTASTKRGATQRPTRISRIRAMWKRLALPFVFMLFLGTPVVLALNANDLRNNLVKIPRSSPVAVSRYLVDGLPLGGHVKSENLAHQEYQCTPSDKFSGFIWCHEEHTTPDNRVMRSHSILQSQDGTAHYLYSYFQPAFFDPNNIQNEIDRMSSEFGQQARIIRMSQREGLPSAVMAIWGAIQLEPLKPDEISVVASGGSPPGILVGFIGDEERFRKSGCSSL